MEQFSILLKRQWQENRRTFWIASLVLLGATALLYAYNIVIDPFFQSQGHDLMLFARFSGLSFRLSVITIIGGIYLGLFSGQYFSAFGKPGTAIQELMLPVSALMRTICAFLLSGLLMVLSSALIFLLVDGLFVSALRLLFQQELLDLSHSVYAAYGSDTGFEFIRSIQPLDRFLKMAGVGLFLCSTFTLGSLYFPKLSFLKTSVFLLLLFGIGSVLVTLIKGAIWKGQVRVSPGNLTTVQDGLLGTLILVSLFCWIAVYYRLKEKEI